MGGVQVRKAPWSFPDCSLVFVLLATAPLFGGQAHAERQVLVDLCSEQLLSGVREEASRIYEAHGVHIAWTDRCGEVPSDEPYTARVYVLEELPASNRFRFLHDHRKSGILGDTLPRGTGAPSSVVYVATEPVISKLGKLANDDPAFGRALGRVVAHELAHRFLQSGHTESGLLKERFDRQDLVDDGADLSFDAEQEQALHAVAVDAHASRTLRRSCPSTERGRCPSPPNENPGQDRSAGSHSLTLRWCDPHRLFTSGWKRVGQALVELFDGLDVVLSWKKGARQVERRNPLEREIQVVLVQSKPAEWGLSPMAMGAVLSQNGPQREVYVFFDSVARTLGYAPETLRKRWPTEREKRDLARALSRVIAHEVFHAVLPNRPHADDGLTHFRLDAASLLAGRLHVDEAVAEAFRVELTQGEVRYQRSSGIH